jgi:pimeloyl-ACP methyl ester carboxylesterase
MQLSFDLAAPFKGAHVQPPSFFLTGMADGLNEIQRPTLESLKLTAPGIRGMLEREGVGHWAQQEAPELTNAALVDFLRDLHMS